MSVDGSASTHKKSASDQATWWSQVDPLDLWNTEPFGRVIEDGYFKGRGADDDKGGVMSALAVRMLSRSQCNAA